MAFFKSNENGNFYVFTNCDELLVIKYCINEDGKYGDKELFRLKCNSNPEVAKANHKSDVSETKQNALTSAAMSNCGEYICACDTNNRLHLWKHENLLSIRSLVRKCQKVIFSNSGSNIILADRGGDVFEYPVSKNEDNGNFILGHISLILDIAISKDDKYLATSDRDGKIRISYYPNAYNIRSYCLGHQEFVSSIQFVSLSNEMLISSSGDGTIRLWHVENNSMQTKCVTLHENELLSKFCNIKNSADINKKLDNQLSENLKVHVDTVASYIHMLAP
ncbi:hypothetical protein CEXT_395611 [Caerostris extrusa]|uniref:WD repeat-containing protein 4 homolog n=1 Tax=Caerostris extrusa TaxID=172846 RepID=A0AAV4YBF2_CAEEX|nr:hypothetical protein CEXT_395611 [Caerostris extrusa]